MSEPKRHHFVPQLLLRNFVNDDGLLFYFDKSAPYPAIRARSPKVVLNEWHLYTSVGSDGSRDVSQELAYSRLENLAKPVIDKIIAAARTRQVPHLSTMEKRTWDVFLYEQWRRVPEVLKGLYSEEDWQRQINDAVLDIEAKIDRPLSADECAEVASFRDTARFRQSVLVKALGKQSRRTVGVLNSRGLSIGVAPQGRSFVIGSKPTVRFSSPTSTRLDDPGVEFWLPIAHDVIVSPGSADPSYEQLFFLDTPMVRKVNAMATGQSTKIVARSESLLRSLLRPR
ncbi:DUF4238 domain-containing protein [Devosia sp.]|uniref:DUF4238 domain-containing protein n=1 Tax=Devosia sp. TaxID=1871048 RepID=UPI0029313F00|nr:DUF4238 domain-containing protein [Devosia sp.]